MMEAIDSAIWERRIRVCFWIIGITMGVALTYTTRHFINSDVLPYMEMGELFLRGQWGGLVNTTYSPAYPLLLGVAQVLFQTHPSNEILILKTVNLFCLLLAMGGCELMMSLIRAEYSKSYRDNETALGKPLMSALCYAMFLAVALVSIRVRLMNPDMLVLFVVTICVSILLWIRTAPQKYGRFLSLGGAIGIGYLVKAMFFLYSPILLAIAALACKSVKNALPRVVAAAIIMILISAPLIVALSHKVGRFSYGEGGRHIYAVEIAGQGQPRNVPKVINEKPRVTLYKFDLPCTDPATHDVCYWTIGVVPKYNLFEHASVFLRNVWLIFKQSPWLILIAIWFVIQAWCGSIRLGSFRPLSLTFILLLVGLSGIMLFCLIRMEPRYIAPFLFVSFIGLVTSVRYPLKEPKSIRWGTVSTIILTVLLLGVVIQSAVDQTIRSLYSTPTKLSYRDAYHEQLAVKNYLLSHGIQSSNKVAVMGNVDYYWARMAGVKIVAYISDQQEFLKSTPEERMAAINSLRQAGIKAVVGKGKLPEILRSDGWESVPDTKQYYADLLAPKAKSTK